ncbi:hypothetical protein HNQ60_002568 [Povalibacter uvarum]|uniref:DUF3667 domain-containing protein n=1 Tax=Povalibacter uvarum TaxID=732238 RepID=A0A841HKV6_9GAMM|nr:DUF3667 domain-containing protein [Povalibacter uvarum]MBB6093687.1 hypothetical protein [Povalibacter uvarum]
MGAEGEAAGDVLTGAVIGGTVEGATNAAGKQAHAGASGACLNCGATVTGAYCSNCGQRAHLHRSLLSIGHDILHGVFHFEGKVWHTLPELFFRPGRLTRRYIDGERAKFVSPMALYLFTVFLMFAVFSFTSTNFNTGEVTNANVVTSNFKEGNQSVIEESRKQIEQLRRQLAEPNLSDDQRKDLQDEITGMEASIRVMESLSAGNFKGLADFADEQKRKSSAENTKVDFGVPAFDQRMTQALRDINENPRFLIYKLKTAGYKYSWALIPLSLPFMWILFFWRRNVHMYDHAIFVTYSLTFMMMLLILVSIVATFGLPAAIWGSAIAFIPPIHMYKQLRGAYGLSRFGAFVRLFLLLIATCIVLTFFSVLLVLIGVAS